MISKMKAESPPEYSPWKCDACGRSDLTRVQQSSKCKGTGRCYWCCLTNTGMVRSSVSRHRIASTPNDEMRDRSGSGTSQANQPTKPK